MKELIKKTIEDILKIMNFEGNINLIEDDDESVIVNIETEEAPLLIGQGGANLISLQQIAKKIIEKKSAEPCNFTLDVNNYKRHKMEILKEMARHTADKVLVEGRAVIMQPMNAFERRIVHMTLANYQNLMTESQGEEPWRRIVVKAQNTI